MFRFRHRCFVLATLLPICFWAMICAAETPKTDKAGEELAAEKKIPAAEAYWRWKAAPDKVHVLDVRTPQEYEFVGHASMARNIPFRLWTGEWDAAKKRSHLKPNPDFLAMVKKHFKPGDTILVMCRSRDRADVAVQAMLKEGFSNAYMIEDGFEGDVIRDESSYQSGRRLKNGWKNSGAPWTGDLDPNLMFLPAKTNATQ